MSERRVQTGDSVGRFFSDFAETWDSLYGGKRNPLWRWFDSTFRRDVYERYELTFERVGTDLKGKRVLDVGCGSGVYCFEAARRGAKVVGIDAAPNMITHARATSMELGLERECQFLVGTFPADVQGSEISDPFDYAIALGVMDYVSDSQSFLSAMRRSVKRAAILSFPGNHWLRAPLRAWRYRLLARPAVYTYSEEDIGRLCAEAGFRSVDILRLPHSGICYVVTARP